MRGVQKINSKTVTSSMLGNFRSLSSLLNIFLLIIWKFSFFVGGGRFYISFAFLMIKSTGCTKLSHFSRDDPKTRQEFLTLVKEHWRPYEARLEKGRQHEFWSRKWNICVIQFHLCNTVPKHEKYILFPKSYPPLGGCVGKLKFGRLLRPACLIYERWNKCSMSIRLL